MSASAGVHRVTSGPARDRAGGDLGTVVDVRAADMPVGRQGGGCVHHVAFRAADDAAQAEMVGTPNAQGLRPTEQVNRCCFRSAYFREPDGVLFEIATDDPGFTVDEPKETLGDAIKLPPWYESRRAEIVAGAASASLIAGAAKRRSARRWSRQILFCAPGAGLIPSPRARSRSNYVCAEGCEGNEAFIVGGYRREYWR